jgi:hypothetical protein
MKQEALHAAEDMACCGFGRPGTQQRRRLSSLEGKKVGAAIRSSLQVSYGRGQLTVT